MPTRQLSVLVAAHSGNFSGVETYAEQVARAGAAASHKVTLVAVGADVAAELHGRIGQHVRVLATAPLSRSAWRKEARRVPTLALLELQDLVQTTLRLLGERFDVAHLNHPLLARAARPYADRVVVAGWFYPHGSRERVAETWRHTGAAFPRSAAFALKGLSHQWNDRQGYRASDCVVAPTELLATQLEAIGVHAVMCPPPSGPSRRDSGQSRAGSGRADGRRHVTIICGDLSHPRKNVGAGIEAVKLVAASGMKIDLELIGRKADAFAAQLGALPESVRVLTPGPLPHARVLERLLETDALIVPSLYEEWGYVATEALLSGTPVVAFPVYPFVEILAPPYGVCADDMSPRALARAVAQTLVGAANPSLLAAAAEDRFGVEAIGRRLTSIWSGHAVDDREPAVVVGRLG
jgi:glycosyltransferase involved in cell wall biosynthesis